MTFSTKGLYSVCCNMSKYMSSVVDKGRSWKRMKTTYRQRIRSQWVEAMFAWLALYFRFQDLVLDDTMALEAIASITHHIGRWNKVHWKSWLKRTTSCPTSPSIPMPSQVATTAQLRYDALPPLPSGREGLIVSLIRPNEIRIHGVRRR